MCKSPGRQSRRFLCAHQRRLPECSCKPFLVFYSAAIYKNNYMPYRRKAAGDSVAFMSFPPKTWTYRSGQKASFVGDNPGIRGWGRRKAILSLLPSSNYWIPNYRLVSGDLPCSLRCVWELSSVVAWAWCLPLAKAAVVGGGGKQMGVVPNMPLQTRGQ